jgi:drug/metabolite transporter (DMT)-like permease
VVLGEHVSDIQFSSKMWMVFAWTLLVNSLSGQPLWYFLLKRGSATTATSLQFLVPPMGMFLGWIGLGETIGLVDIASLVPIALGIRLVTRERAVAVPK